MEGFRDTTDGDLALSSHPDVHINSKLGPQLRKDLSTVPLGSLTSLKPLKEGVEIKFWLRQSCFSQAGCCGVFAVGAVCEVKRGLVPSDAHIDG